MKKLIFLSAMAVAVAVCTSCSNSSYANELKAEKELIAEYIKRENINIIYELPADSLWGEKDYLEIDDNLYFHLVNPGTGTDTVEYKDRILIRYKRYTLEVYADTVDYWTTNELAYPTEFEYMVSSDYACTAWHEAVSYMKRDQSEAKIIVPSKLGFDDDNSSVIPYGYDIKIRIRK